MTSVSPVVRLAGRTAEEAAIPFADLPLLEDAEQALSALAALGGLVDELRERLAADRLDFETRVELAQDAYEHAALLQSFALGLSLAVQR